MSTQYKLGEVIEKKNKRWLVVRIVKSQSLFETDEGNTFTLDEHYIELRSPQGEAGFVILSSERNKYEGSKGNIKALSPIYYGRRNFDGKAGSVGSESSSEGRDSD